MIKHFGSLLFASLFALALTGCMYPDEALTHKPDEKQADFKRPHITDKKRKNWKAEDGAFGVKEISLP